MRAEQHSTGVRLGFQALRSKQDRVPAGCGNAPLVAGDLQSVFLSVTTSTALIHRRSGDRLCRQGGGREYAPVIGYST